MWDERDWCTAARRGEGSEPPTGWPRCPNPTFPDRVIPPGFGGLHGPDDHERRTHEVDRVIAALRRR